MPRVEVPEFRDQGFTRPRVLVLLPFRHSALQFVRSLLRLLLGGCDGASGKERKERQIINRNRFFSEFSADDNELGLHHDAADGDKDDDASDDDGSSGGVLSGVLSQIGKAQRQMMSEDEAEDDRDDDEEEAGDGGSGSESDDGGAAAAAGRSASAAGGGGAGSRYPFNSLRQGWPSGLRDRLRAEQRPARNGGGDSDKDSDDDDGYDGRGKRKPGAPGKRKRPKQRADATIRGAMKIAGESILGSTAALDAHKKAREKEKRRKARAAAAAARNPLPIDYQKTFSGNVSGWFCVGSCRSGAVAA